ncbi:MAG: endonuclease/exonuclease/phosphatase family protein [Burkholderiales bacterium]|nr:endonuclease/exonuclease/phosphatase family protein [Burkholderiales bacterium]
MHLITWNIQSCRGCDGHVDAKRIVDVCRDMADFDVLCLQEVASNYPELPGSPEQNQFEQLAALLPGFAAADGIATDVLGAGGRRRLFGNLILTRYPLIRVFRHLLPWPADPTVPGMQRVALETVLAAPFGPLRVTTTHLEYYSEIQRRQQVNRLRELHAEAAQHSADRSHAKKEGGPFQTMPRPASSILTADFNFRADDPLHARIVSPYSDGTPAYRDAWQVRHGTRPHDHTIGVHDRKQWPEAFACDFIFVTEDLAGRIEDIKVNLDTDASDHQPVLLHLQD